MSIFLKRVALTLMMSVCAVGYAEESAESSELISRGEAMRGGAGGYRGGARYEGERGTFDENGHRYGEDTPYGNGRGAAYERGLNQGYNEGDVNAGGYYIDPYAGENWNYGYPPPPPQNPSSEQYSTPPPQNYGYPAGPQ